MAAEVLPISDGIVRTSSTSNSSSINPRKSRLTGCYEFFHLLFGPELSLFLYCVGYGVLAPAQQNFVYRQICLYKFQSEKLCSQIDTSPALQAEEDAVQADYTVYSTISTVSSTIPAVFVTLIMGEWADRFSFRIPLALPHIGVSLTTTCLVAYSYFPTQPFDPIYLGAASVFSGLSGSLTTAIVACASYVSRITSGHNRTVRLGAIEASFTLGATVGYFINAFILRRSSPVMAFVIQIAINLYTVVFIFSIVRELHSYRQVKARVDTEAGGSWFRFIFAPRKDLFSAFAIIFGRSPKYMHIRSHIMAMVFVFSIASVASLGLSAVSFDFLTLQPISMAPFTYAIFQAVSSVTISVSLLVGLRVLRSGFNFSDAAIGITGFVSRIMGCIALGLGEFYPAYAPWVYCACTMMSLNIYVVIRSGLSKLTEDSEHGRIFSALSLFENVFGSLSTIGMNALYGTLISTSYSYPITDYLVHGYTILFCAAVCLPPLLVVVWLGKQKLVNWSFHSSFAKL